MLIGTWDISEANAKQRRLEIGHHEIKNNSVWNEASGRPVFAKTGLGWKPIHVELIVKGRFYEEIVANAGTIINRLKDLSTVQFDVTNPVHLLAKSVTVKPDHQFDVVLDKYSVDETVKDRWHILSLDLIGVEYGPIVVEKASSVSEIVIDNPGNIETPVTLVVRPNSTTTVDGSGGTQAVQELAVDKAGNVLFAMKDENGNDVSLGNNTAGGLKLHINGMCVDPATGEDIEIVIGDLTTGNTIIIDGDTGRITDNGAPKIDDVEIWNLPSIKPGINIIKTNAQFIDLEVQFRPRYF